MDVNDAYKASLLSLKLLNESEDFDGTVNLFLDVETSEEEVLLYFDRLSEAFENLKGAMK